MHVPKAVIALAAVLGAALGGYGIANAANGSGSSTTTTTTTPAASQPAPPGRPAFNGPAHGTAAHEDAEKPVTGTAASKAKAAAIAAAGGGTAGDVTTDFTGDGYEVTVTKDGTSTEYHLDSSFNVRAGGPGGR
jgi:hypothetical protein